MLILINRKNQQNRPLIHIGGIYAEEPSTTMQFTPVDSGQITPMASIQFTQTAPTRMRPRTALPTKEKVSDRPSGI